MVSAKEIHLYKIRSVTSRYFSTLFFFLVSHIVF